MSRDIRFYTVEKVNNRENKILLEGIRKVIAVYNSRGFIVKYILADGEFRHTIDSVMTSLKCHLNCTAAGEHVPEAEIAIHLIKEHIRCIVTSWHFKIVPKVFKISLMKFVVFWLKFSTPKYINHAQHM